MIMNLANILKIAYAASKATEMGGYLASGGKANQLSNIASVVGQAAGAGAQMAGAVNTNPGQAAGAAVKADTVNTGQMHEALKGQSGVKETLIQGGKKDITTFKPDATKADPLKVNPGGYTANQPKLQEAYLEGLKQSGAKLNKTGEIVKQSGQAYKKPGWDRKAQLMAMDPMRRQRLLAIDKASVSAAKNKVGPAKTNTGKSVIDSKRPESPLEKELREEGSSWSLLNATDDEVLKVFGISR